MNDWIPAATFAFTVITTLGGGLLALAIRSHRQTVRIEVGKLRETINNRTQEIVHNMAEHEAEDITRFAAVRAEMTTVTRDVEVTFGDSLGALRQQMVDHMHRLELVDAQQRVDVRELLATSSKSINDRLDIHHVELGGKIDTLTISVHQLEVNFAASGVARRVGKG